MKKLILVFTIGVLALAGLPAAAQDAAMAHQILIMNVNVFDGINEALLENVNVVVTGNTITEISTDELAITGGTVIDGEGHTLLPGIIDTHTHLMFSGITFPEVLFQRQSYGTIQGTLIARDTLMNGITTVRDMAGDTFGLKRAIDGGVKSIEHGQLLDKATLERMADEGVWLSIQPFTECHESGLTEAQNAKQAIVCKGTGQVYEWIKEIPDLKVVHSTDIFISPGPGIGVSEQVEQMERLLDWFTPYEILKMSTGNATELLQLSGPRNPYPGVLGRVEKGALADLLLVKGNPLEDLTMVTNRENIQIIMKDGKIYKNTLN